MGMMSEGPKGGLACRRALLRLPFLLLGLAGLWLAAQGVWIPAKAELAQLLLERAFAAASTSKAPVKPWPWADAASIARIGVPRLGVEQIVLSAGSGQAMAFGPTLMPGGGRLGARGTAIVAAHRDTHFRFLKHLRAGDEISVEEAGGRTTRYTVTGMRVVRRDGFALDRHTPSPSLALVTCWPFDAAERGPLRYVVEAAAVAPRGYP
jgi:sortase A